MLIVILAVNILFTTSKCLDGGQWQEVILGTWSIWIMKLEHNRWVWSYIIYSKESITPGLPKHCLNLSDWISQRMRRRRAKLSETLKKIRKARFGCTDRALFREELLSAVLVLVGFISSIKCVFGIKFSSSCGLLPWVVYFFHVMPGSKLI